MFEKIKQMYSSKLIDNCNEFNENYYYFYHNDSNQVFGIDKSIAKNEYELLKHQFVEKKIYSSNSFEQKIYEYLKENKLYPFESSQKIFVLNSLNKELLNLFSDFYKDLHHIELFGTQVIFCKENDNLTLSEYVEPIMDDFGINLKVHEGIVINNQMKGKDVFEYLQVCSRYLNDNSSPFFDICELFLNTTLNEHLAVKKVLLAIASKIINEPSNKSIIEALFKNDLNVSQAAKSLYLNRSTLLKKFEIIKNKTGLNIQKFTHACTIYLLLK